LNLDSMEKHVNESTHLGGEGGRRSQAPLSRGVGCHIFDYPVRIAPSYPVK
jgi:hypothetical protein